MKVYSALLLMLLIFWACEQPTQPKYKPEPNVVAILNPHLNKQKIYVGRSYEMPEDVTGGRWSGISNAEVKVSYNDSIKVLFSELPDTVGVYESESLLVESGKTYFLEVIYPDGKKVKGKTTVPEKFNIKTPINGDTVELEQELTWEESAGAKGYLLYFNAPHLPLDSNVYIDVMGGHSDLGFSNSMTFNSVFIRYIDAGYTPKGGERLTLQIWALDSNYYDYYRIGWYNEPIESCMHLNGGLGVFGSFTVTDSITVVIKP